MHCLPKEKLIILILWLVFFLFCIAVLICVSVTTFSRPQLSGTEIEEAFQQKHTILRSNQLSIAVNAPILVDLIVDIFSRGIINNVDDRPERAMLILCAVIPGFLILKCESSENFEMTFCSLYSIQGVGSIAAIYSLLMRQIPECFSPARMLVSFCFWATATALSLYIFRNPLSRIWPTFMMVLFLLISQVLFGEMLWKWFKKLAQRSPLQGEKSVLRIFKCMSDTETCLSLYIILVEVFGIGFHSIIAAVAKISWSNIDLPGFLVGIWSFACFSILTGIVPNRMLQHLAAKQEKKLHTNHSAIRYISHEIRSPLNIVQNGIKLVIEELKENCSAGTLETLIDAHHASCAASAIVDDLLSFENIEAGKFQIQQRVEDALPCFTQIANRCRSLVCEKGIHFHIKNQLEPCAHGFVYAIYVDALKLERVVNHFIMKSIKCTPTEGNICVALKHTGRNSRPSQVAAERYHRPKSLFSKGPVKTMKIYCEPKNTSDSQHPQAPGSNSDRRLERIQGGKTDAIAIEISDNGAGLSRLQLDKNFKQYVEFDSNILRGGGESGLGAWICKEIIRQHNGEISVTSRGPAHGITVSILLDCFIIETGKANSNSALNGLQGSDSATFLQSLSRVRYDLACNKNTHHCDEKLERVDESLSLQSLGDDFDSIPDSNRTVHILVVDDSALNRKMLIRLIKRIKQNFEGKCEVTFEFKEADDGSTALQEMNSYGATFDVVFLDNIMLTLNGPMAATLMRQQHFIGKIIGVTGNSSEADVSEFILHGADEVFIKPVCLEQIHRVLFTLISSS